MLWSLFGLGFVGGALIAAIIGRLALSDERQAHLTEMGKTNAHFRWERTCSENESRQLKEAIAAAQKLLAEANPPRTEHKVSY